MYLYHLALLHRRFDSQKGVVSGVLSIRRRVITTSGTEIEIRAPWKTSQWVPMRKVTVKGSQLTLITNTDEWGHCASITCNTEMDRLTRDCSTYSSRGRGSVGRWFVNVHLNACCKGFLGASAAFPEQIVLLIIAIVEVDIRLQLESNPW